MDKLTYLAELAEGLARWVPERERQDILRYYAEYFEEAGPEREAEVARELGDPWALSCRLAVEGGYVTQEGVDGWMPPKKKRWPWVLAGTLACVAIIGVSVAYAASQLGRFVGGLVGQRTEETEVVEQVDKAQFGTATEDEVTYVNGAEYAGDSSTGFWNRKDGYLDIFEGIDVDISFGNVTITEGDDYTLDIQQVGDLNGYELKWEIKDGALRIRDAKSGGAHINFDGMFGEHSMNVGITVPGNARLDKLNVKTSLGDIFLSDLVVEKKLDAKTNLGDVGVYGVSARELEAESDLGDVECYDSRIEKELTLDSKAGDVVLGLDELFQGLEIDLETNLGQVDASLNCSERECGYKLKCSLGEVTVDGVGRGDKAEQKGSHPYRLEAKSDLGDVNVSFRAD